jgi:hypothetical protein
MENGDLKLEVWFAGEKPEPTQNKFAVFTKPDAFQKTKKMGIERKSFSVTLSIA